jgi:hypothetical protein
MNNSEQKTQACQNNLSSSVILNNTVVKFPIPLKMIWQPQEDITTYELAKCLPYLLRVISVMPYEIDKTENHFRHFEIIDHNK